MSNFIVGEGPQRIPVGRARNPLQISYAVFNKKTQQWETPQLSVEENHMIHAAIDSIRLLGEKSGAIGSEFKKEDALIEITPTAVLVKRDGTDWINILDDRAVPKETRNAFRKIISSVTAVLGDLSKTRSKEALGTAINDDELKSLPGSKGVVIEVKVTPTSQSFSQREEEDRVFDAQVSEVEGYLTSQIYTDFLKSCGFNEEKMTRFQEEGKALKEASESVHAILQNVTTLIRENKIHEAGQYCVEYLPYYYGRLVDAMRNWQMDQWELESVLGVDPQTNPFQIDTSRLEMLEKTFVELAFYAETGDPHHVDFSEALGHISAYRTSFENFIKLADKSYVAIRDLEDKHAVYLADVVKSVEAFEDPDLTEFMKEHGYSEEEIDEHRQRLTELRTVSEEVSALVSETRSLLVAGRVQEAFDKYSEGMRELQPKLKPVLQRLISLQKVANGRLPDPLFIFNIPLDEILRCQLGFLAQSKEIMTNFPVTDSNYTSLLSDRSLDELSFVFESTNRTLASEQSYSSFSNHIDHLQKSYARTTHALAQFVIPFQKYRETLEAMMREEGYSDLETSRICNFLVGASVQLEEWNKEFQKVVDSTNRKDDQQAIEQLVKLFQERYQRVIDAVQPILTNRRLFREARSVFQNFLAQAGVAQPSQVLEHIDHLKDLPKHLLENFEKSLSLFFSRLDEMPPAWIELRSTLQDKLEFFNQFPARFQKVYEKSDLLASLFNYRGILRHPQYGQLWQRLLIKQGWTPQKIEAYINVYQAYAEEIKSLHEAEFAFTHESDPLKKRALRSQLQELANRRTPAINKLQKELQALGGTEVLKSMQQIANEFEKLILQETEAVLRKALQAGEFKEPFVFQNYEELMAQFKTKFEEFSPAERDILNKQSGGLYQIAYDQTGIIQFARRIREGIVNESTDLINQIRKRGAFLERLYTSLDLFAPSGVSDSLSKLLLNGPHGQDRVLFLVLKERGWTKEDISKFDKWNVGAQRAYNKLFLAKSALDKDPENVTLQEAFREVWQKQIPLLNKLNQEFEKMGGVSKMRSLEQAILTYIRRLFAQKQALEALIPQLQSQDTSYKLEVPKEKAEADLKEVETILDFFKTRGFGFKELILERDRWIQGVDQAGILALNWDGHYLSSLFDQKSPLQKLPSWKSLCAARSLTKEDIKDIHRLHLAFQKELKEINRLERELERNPGNFTIRERLSYELNLKKRKFQKLNQEFVRLHPKIDQLQAALKEFSGAIKIELNRHQHTLQEAKSSASDDTRQALEAEARHIWQQAFGKASAEEVEKSLTMVQGIQVLESFTQKTSFYLEALQRFGTLPAAP